jgi:hypothetical protein
MEDEKAGDLQRVTQDTQTGNPAHVWEC